MNYSTAVMLFNDNIRALKVVYDKDQEKNFKERGTGGYLVKTLDDTIQVDDMVVMPTDTRFDMTVVKVVEVDSEIDFDDEYTEVKWIIGKVDVESAQRTLDEEQKWIQAMKASEKRKKKEQIRKNMEDMLNGDKEELTALTFSSESSD